MATTVHGIADPFVEPQVLPPETHSEIQAAGSPAVFTDGEWQQFQAEDESAGRSICKILSTLFLYTLIIVSIVVWWTIRTV